MNYLKSKKIGPMVYMVFVFLCMSWTSGHSFSYAQQKNEDTPKNQADYIKILQTGSDEDKMDAAQGLVHYNNKESVTALINALEAAVNEKKQNHSLIRIYVISLGDLKDRAAFLPLLRLSQKSFPPDVQDAIEKAMDKLQYK